ncbi:MAG: hypothetical protein IH898_03575 [Planctomycetes bacterium]|nr:hypothetical protein [Planctomycetota bacterium]
MSNTMRWRYGETNPIMMPVLDGYIIEIGDLVYLDSGSAKAAAAIADQGTLVANQEALHDQFLGVAMQASPAASTEPIRVATTGVFEFDCASATFEMGDLLGAREEATGTELDNQYLVGVATPNLAVGRCTKRVNPAGTKVLVDTVSTVLRGGPQAAA